MSNDKRFKTIQLGKSLSNDKNGLPSKSPLPLVVKIDGGAPEWHTDPESAVSSITDLLKHELSQGRQITIETNQMREFPMTDGPAIPWSLAGEIYNSDAFDYFEQSRHLKGNGLEQMAKGGGWSWRALGDCFDTYSAQCDYESASDAKLEQRAEAFHAGDS